MIELRENDDICGPSKKKLYSIMGIFVDYDFRQNS